MPADESWLGDRCSEPCEMGGGPVVDYGHGAVHDNQRDRVTSSGRPLWLDEDQTSAWWRLAHDPVALLADAKRQHADKLAAEKRIEQLEKQLAKPRKTVYVIFNNCPEEWADKEVLGVYRNKRDADREAKIIIGGNSVAMQYVEVQKWRLK